MNTVMEISLTIVMVSLAVIFLSLLIVWLIGMTGMVRDGLADAKRRRERNKLMRELTDSIRERR